jgi:hypothetical protein
MPRLARAIAVGCAHHITQRGNNRQDVFLVDQDRQALQEWESMLLTAGNPALLSSRGSTHPADSLARSHPAVSQDGLRCGKMPRKAINFFILL